jgi:hypothetical protein
MTTSEDDEHFVLRGLSEEDKSIMCSLLQPFLDDGSSLHADNASETHRSGASQENKTGMSINPSISSLSTPKQEHLSNEKDDVTADPHYFASVPPVIYLVDKSGKTEHDADLKPPDVTLEDRSDSISNGSESDPQMMDHDADAFAEFPLSVISSQDFSTMRNTKSLFLGWTSHPCYLIYRNVLQEYSGNRQVYPTCPNGIGQLVVQRLRELGVDHVFICVDQDGIPLTNGIFGTGRRSFLGTWVTAFPEEIEERVAQRFMDDRKQRNNPKVNVANLPRRQPWFPNPITEDCVCFDWENHSGTVRFKQVVKTFSDDKECYPKWTTNVANRIQNALHQQGLTIFLVFLNPDGKPSNSIHHGQWFQAMDDECQLMAKKEFQKNRRMDQKA